MCKSLNLEIVNGRFGGDKRVGESTYYTAAGKSVVDYIISSHQLYTLDKCLSDAHSPIWSINIHISKPLEHK